MIATWCASLKRLHSNVTSTWKNLSINGRKNNYGCTIALPSGRRFSVANMFHFGMDTDSQPKQSRKLMSATRLSTEEPIEAVQRLEQVARSSVLQPAFHSNHDPTFLTLHSCAWDMNRTPLNNGSFYEPTLLQRYAKHIARLIRAARVAFRTSSVILETCKPMNVLDVRESTNRTSPTTRTRRLQIALDSMAHLVAQTEGVNIIDATAVLGGFEFWASDSHKIHYAGKGANTLANAMLNELFEA